MAVKNKLIKRQRLYTFNHRLLLQRQCISDWYHEKALRGALVASRPGRHSDSRVPVSFHFVAPWRKASTVGYGGSPRLAIYIFCGSSRKAYLAYLLDLSGKISAYLCTESCRTFMIRRLVSLRRLLISKNHVLYHTEADGRVLLSSAIGSDVTTMLACPRFSSLRSGLQLILTPLSIVRPLVQSRE
ncbi:hypothetical protein L228DRAFT_45174 [Xylona heveae TC161]|uniref:Uncharacterized protein n=1 Tax=Xylona heveae (strain CBS 132557 / TC161) TaxID=1328760 RepID=A0A164ZTZ0_XYLHT|nr:hypothetical protein L228DRAFT_45174 [Xylona heveae TC161]KZF19514.1 hypothetical protein L228DRAFT_45174 [Xylona heveae TC161]